MKKCFAVILLILSCLVLFATLSFGLYGLYTFDELSSQPGTSGIDYFAIALGYSIGMFLFSAVGLLLSIVSRSLQEKQIPTYIATAVIVIFSLLLLSAVTLFYLW